MQPSLYLSNVHILSQVQRKLVCCTCHWCSRRGSLAGALLNHNKSTHHRVMGPYDSIMGFKAVADMHYDSRAPRARL